MTLMVKDIFPKAKPKAGDVGIEIEVEGDKEAVKPLTSALTEHWMSKDDGTLRGGFGIEMVSREALYLNTAFDRRIKNIVEHIRQTKIVEDSLNTSVHVHHNMTHKSMMGVLNAATAWWLLENLLVNYCGPDREANMFCLRLTDAEALVPRLTSALERYKLHIDLNDTYRYAALNLKALAEFGSLEVRSMRGNVAAEPIIEWATQTNYLFSRAMEFKNPADVFNFFLKASKQKFVEHFFSSGFALKLLALPDWQQKIDDSAVLVCNFAYALDWPTWEERYKEYLAKNPPKQKRSLTNVASWADETLYYD